jgi:hypothetical protein
MPDDVPILAADGSVLADHEHDFSHIPYRHAGMCRRGDCTEMRVYEGWKKGYRKLTATEMVDVLVIQIEDIAIAQAMTSIHGETYGMRRAREVLGYG